MSYVVNKTNGNIVAVVEDGTIDSTSTSLTLFGRGVQNYGEFVAENMVRLAENFANSTSPSNPLPGQLWFNTDTKALRVYDGVEWTSPVAASFYSTVDDSTGYAKLTVKNDSGIVVGDRAQIQLMFNATSGKLEQVVRHSTGTNQLTAISIDPGTGLVEVAGPPGSTNGVATKGYVDSLSSISSGQSSVVAGAFGVNVISGGTTVIGALGDQLVFSGKVYAPTVDAVASGDEVATAAFVQAQKVNTVLAGVPEADTAFTSDNSRRLATTAFVQNNNISPAFSGTPTAPTATAETSSSQIATTEFVHNVVNSTHLTPYALKENAVLTGTPVAPTATVTTATDQLATTAFVRNLINSVSLVPYAPKESPIFSGVPLVPTPTIENRTQQIANTQFVQDLVVTRMQPYAPRTSPVFTGVPTGPHPGPSSPLAQLATVQYVNETARSEVSAALSGITSFQITSGYQRTNTYTNAVGSWYDSGNFFDVFPPAGSSMSNLVAFIPSIAVIYYNGTVNSDDSTRCNWTRLVDRVRVYVQNTEQRAAPGANWLAVWRK